MTSGPAVPKTGPLPSATMVAGAPWHVGGSSAPAVDAGMNAAHASSAARGRSFFIGQPYARGRRGGKTLNDPAARRPDRDLVYIFSGRRYRPVPMGSAR